MCHPTTGRRTSTVRRGLALAFLTTLFTAALLLAGCASPGPYRATTPVVTAPGYTLGFVEFDQQGWFWTADRAQLSAVEKAIVQSARLKELDAAGRRVPARGIILVAFVHGWKHNAAPDDTNVASFRRLLETLARHEAELPEAERHPVVGVYLGWPGLAAKVEPALELSFYSRKNTGDKVGYYGGVTETLVRLRNLHSLINGLRGQNPRSYLVVAGHSFGAQVVFNSLAPIMAEQLVNERTELEVDRARSALSGHVAAERAAPRPVVKPFGDLVLLVNPAFEAARYRNLKSLAELFHYPPAQRPVLGIFSSKTDSATRRWFPLGRFFSTLFETYRDDALAAEQRAANHRTVPWIDRYVTHELVKAGEPKPGGGARVRTLATVPAGSATTAYMADIVRNWETLKFGELPLAGAVLCPLRPAAEWTPFYVVRVNRSLMHEHSGIWGEEFSDFIASFVTVSIRGGPAGTPPLAPRAP